MLLAFAVLLIHPQMAATTSLAAKMVANGTPVATSASSSSLTTDRSAPAAPASFIDTTQPEDEARAALPAEPVPVGAITTPARTAILNPGGHMIISVAELRAENRRKLFIWRSLVVASSGAATFDALTTRYAITTDNARELNPLLKPFAGNSSLFAAIQVAPAMLDLASSKMMYSRHSVLRKTWWLPQSLSFVSSMFCGAHNLAFH